MGGSLGQESWQVVCRSGWTYAERPLALLRNSASSDILEIQEIEQMWRDPQGRHFVVALADHSRFHLLYHEAEDRWIVETA